MEVEGIVAELHLAVPPPMVRFFQDEEWMKAHPIGPGRYKSLG